MNPWGLLLVAPGLFVICGAAFNWEWFLNNRKARFVITRLGRTGARIAYGLLGGAVVGGFDRQRRFAERARGQGSARRRLKGTP